MNPRELLSQKTFTVSLKGLAPWVSGVRYERDKADLKLHFTLKPGENPLSEQQNSSEKLLKKILSRTEYLVAHNLYFAHLSAEDFAQTGSTHKTLVQIFPRLRASFGEHVSYLFFFEHNNVLRGIAWSKHAAFRQKLLRITPAQEKGSWVLFEPTTNTISHIKHVLLSS